MGPPKRRRGPPGGSDPSSENVATGNGDNSEITLSISRAQLGHRQIGPGELAHILAYRERWRRLRVLPGGQP